MIEDGIGYCAPFRSLRLTPAPSARRRGSNGEAEARIPLKINLFLSSQPTTTILLLQTKAERRRRGLGWKMGLATALPYRSLRLTPAPSARRRGSNGEAEARIPLKINIFLSSQPT